MTWQPATSPQVADPLLKVQFRKTLPAPRRPACTWVFRRDEAGTGVERARFVRVIGLEVGYGGDGTGLEFYAIGVIYLER